MRSILALPALIAVAVVAQETFTFGETATRSRSPASTGDNVEPSATETITGPISTASACAEIAEAVSDSNLDFPTVDAELAYACLQSVPISQSAASDTIDSLKQMAQFQSTLTYLKSPPEGYYNDGVDIEGGLDDIKSKVNNGDYDNEFDFESDIAALLTKAHDGHFGFEGMAFNGVFRWRRSRQVTLISASSDGKEAPKIWASQDFNNTNSGSPSAISKINGKDALQFLEEESLQNSYHDPDTRFNAMFYMQPAESLGLFANPRFYPGAETNLTFENGTEYTFTNFAVLMDTSGWSYIEDGRTFYQTYITPSTTSKKAVKRENPHKLPRNLQYEKEAELSQAYNPINYPEPVIMHSASDVPLAGYFIDTSAGTIGILMIQTFNTESSSDSVEFQAVIQEYISQAQSRNVAKHVLDVRDNGGGKIFLGYDAYLQFFPSQKPQLQSRYRATDAHNILGESISTVSFRQDPDVYNTPFHYHFYNNKDLEAFGSWQDMFGPTEFGNDKFTNLLRYNLSDPLTTTSDTYGVGIEMTGYGTRSNFTEDPFSKDDIIILSDGICASTCSLFTELMVQQSGVKTIAVGGRSTTGPMQAVGGTKGSLVLTADFLQRVSYYVIQNFATSNSEANQWAQTLPNTFGIAYADATVNFQDNIRKGLEQDGTPTQFLNDTASCRIYYEPNDYMNVTRLWEKTALVAFGNDGKLDDTGCVSGSVSSQEAQQGQGDGNPTTTTPQGGSAKPSSSKGAAAALFQSAQTGWTAVMACGSIVLGSMAFGASLI
ncbi:peptidase S41 family protein-like protein [Lophiotrema nucula]|uniref:Peptidase S41 family protein-like protein n=1 Tax=Lophiotrema nucula TaxID=690887 RepID=A0A6A5YJS3_9PLEO|nr:peptidase S41 family protein-like protein [Lophiotrema nucula]